MTGDDRLSMILADHLMVPLLQIARLSEQKDRDSLSQISLISNQTLGLLQAYVESTSQTQLLLEPILPGSILYDLSNQLKPLAQHYGCTLTIDSTSNKPVMAHRRSLKSILALTAVSLIEAANDEDEASKTIVLGSHNSKRGLIVGSFTASEETYKSALSSMRVNQNIQASSMPIMGAALAVADRLSERMGTALKAYTHDSNKGLGNLLLSSHQLKLV